VLCYHEAMIESLQQYHDNVTLLEDTLEFHPDFLDQVDSADKEILSQYYFAGRPVDVDDLDAYRNGLIAKDAGIESRAVEALTRFKAANKIQ
jgi:hypothetical protein